MEIIDNFLAEKEFVALRDVITAPDFDWHFSPGNDELDEERSSPGLFTHIIHGETVPFGHSSSCFRLLFLSLLSSAPFPGLNGHGVHLARIRLNLNCKFPEPCKYQYHLDMTLDDHASVQWTTSILYINTNNGYTEFKDGTTVESVANRLVSFPANILHRGISQTDEETRILINFNYLSREKGGYDEL
jgi:hypothetical protein